MTQESAESHAPLPAQPHHHEPTTTPVPEQLNPTAKQGTELAISQKRTDKRAVTTDRTPGSL
ncbi:hypothetical protein, partial [Amycolatopsis sp. NPDC059657]|uniref:hypothetical protein n=1 Tax=Amycolatopsis sp. NPDC059657 TaxID=3346899 RepID=UPI00366A5776